MRRQFRRSDDRRSTHFVELAAFLDGLNFRASDNR